MTPFASLTARVAPLPADHVDTDQIIPARFLKVTSKHGLADKLFADWRQAPDFVLNQPAVKGSEILLAGEDFGCGSSREHAPWALMAWGFRAIVAKGFADIFRNNALKNGLLPIEVDAAVADALFEARAANPELVLSVDLRARALHLPGGDSVGFPIDDFSRHCLLEGIDQLGYLRRFEPHIAAFEDARAGRTQAAS